MFPWLFEHFDHLRKISEDQPELPTILQRFSENVQRWSKGRSRIFRLQYFVKFSKDYRSLPQTPEDDPKTFRPYPALHSDERRETTDWLHSSWQGINISYNRHTNWQTYCQLPNLPFQTEWCQMI